MICLHLRHFCNEVISHSAATSSGHTHSVVGCSATWVVGAVVVRYKNSQPIQSIIGSDVDCQLFLPSSYIVNHHELAIIIRLIHHPGFWFSHFGPRIRLRSSFVLSAMAKVRRHGRWRFCAFVTRITCWGGEWSWGLNVSRLATFLDIRNCRHGGGLRSSWFTSLVCYTCVSTSSRDTSNLYKLPTK